MKARFATILTSTLVFAFLSGGAFAKTICESEIEHRTLVVELTKDQVGAGSTRKDLLAAENILREAQRNCGVIDEATYKEKMLESYAELLTIVEREVREGTAVYADYAALMANWFDLRWRVLAISTADYCREKFDLLQLRRSAAEELLRSGEGRPSGVLEAELAIQKLREFCDLEGSIALPPNP